jgi:ketosteroid isomerase-like protein
VLTSVQAQELENDVNINAPLVSFVISMTFIAAGSAQAGDRFSQSEAEKYIKDSEAAWAESVATNDASVVKRILADDVVWVLDGKVLDKSRAVAGAQQGPGNFVSNHLDYANVRFFGDTAVVQGSETWTRKTGGRVTSFGSTLGSDAAGNGRSSQPKMIQSESRNSAGERSSVKPRRVPN